MKNISLIFLLMITSSCSAQESVFRQIKPLDLHYAAKDLLKTMPPYDSLFVKTGIVWGTSGTSFIHFLNGVPSAGFFMDAGSLFEIAVKEKLSKEDTSIFRYVGIFKDTIFMEVIPKPLADSIIPLLNGIAQLKTDPVFDSCAKHSMYGDDEKRLVMQKIILTDSSISEGEFYALNTICKYCPDNKKYKLITTIPDLFNKACEPVADIIRKKIKKLVLKRFTELQQ